MMLGVKMNLAAERGWSPSVREVGWTCSPVCLGGSRLWGLGGQYPAHSWPPRAPALLAVSALHFCNSSPEEE